MLLPQLQLLNKNQTLSNLKLSKNLFSINLPALIKKFLLLVQFLPSLKTLPLPKMSNSVTILKTNILPSPSI